MNPLGTPEQIAQQLAIQLAQDRAKFPNNKSLPRHGNNRGHVHKNKARRIRAQQAASRQANR